MEYQSAHVPGRAFTSSLSFQQQLIAQNCQQTRQLLVVVALVVFVIGIGHGVLWYWLQPSSLLLKSYFCAQTLLWSSVLLGVVRWWCAAKRHAAACIKRCQCLKRRGRAKN